MNSVKKILIYVSLLVFIAGCTVSEKDALEQSEKAAEEEFVAAINEPNTEGKTFSYYLPSGFETVSDSENNIILHEGDSDYILFINPLEDASSDVLYQASIDGDEIMTHSFNEKSRLGFVIVTPMEEEKMYELVVGVGGRKMTTVTTRKDMADNTQLMMQIINSIQK